jgi:hypothetical protein
MLLLHPCNILYYITASLIFLELENYFAVTELYIYLHQCFVVVLSLLVCFLHVQVTVFNEQGKTVVTMYATPKKKCRH